MRGTMLRPPWRSVFSWMNLLSPPLSQRQHGFHVIVDPQKEKIVFLELKINRIPV